MLELVVLGVIGVGLYRRRGRRRWEWSRRSLRAALSDLYERGRRLLTRGRRSLPGFVETCRADVASLFRDLLRILHPSARDRIERGARTFFERGGSGVQTPAGGAVRGVATAGGGVLAEGAAQHMDRRAYASLQRRYLEGRITLDEYVAEADRLGGDGAG